MPYIYRHIRIDTDEVFYIGVGSDKYHKRSRTKSYRNKHWHNIVNKTDYEIEIMIDNIPIEEAHKKEIEFIKLYGRQDLNQGTLVNMTDGGEGMVNVSIETKNKLRKLRLGKNNPMFGRSLTPEQKIKATENSRKYWENYRLSHTKKIRSTMGRGARGAKLVLNLETGIFYSSAKEASLTTNYKYDNFKTMLNGNSKNKTNFKYV